MEDPVTNTAGNPDSTPILLVGAELAEPMLIELTGGRVAVITRPHSSMEPNQDAAAVIPAEAGGSVLAVADGMGGTHRGADAAEIAVRRLGEGLAGGPVGKLRTAILNAIESANQHLVSELPYAGTTLAVVEIDDCRARPYHIGDSAILAFGRGGKLKLQTVAHSPVGFGVEAGLLDPDEAMFHDERHIVSNAMGCPGMRIELGAPIQLARHDTVLVASDGLTDNLSVEEIVEIARKGPLDRAAAELARLAWKRMTEEHPDRPSKQDDLTILLYRRSC
jgi:serine/threonine protein phosphatase PrpC